MRAARLVFPSVHANCKQPDHIDTKSWSHQGQRGPAWKASDRPVTPCLLKDFLPWVLGSLPSMPMPLGCLRSLPVLRASYTLGTQTRPGGPLIPYRQTICSSAHCTSRRHLQLWPNQVLEQPAPPSYHSSSPQGAPSPSSSPPATQLPWSLGDTLASSPFLTPTSNQCHVLWDLPPKEIPSPMTSPLLAWVPAPIISHMGEGLGPLPSCPQAGS